jgi:hypothetical protein
MLNSFRRSSHTPLLGAVATVAALVSAMPAPAAHKSKEAIPGTGCGGVLWRQMALSDADRFKVDLDAVATTIHDIAGLRPPRRIVNARTTSFQRRAWHVHAVIDRYRIATSGEIVLILYSIDTNQYMNAYLPNPRCLTRKSRDRAGILAARRTLTRHCPHATTQWQLLGISTEVTGVGFWNQLRTTRGASPNGAELRPVTNFVIDSGCGVG